ncbi:uncharacterized protein J8A68_002695 [[Candida] subhashii]|uniref:AAA+ ATPase domain-containing protein n=1 Tax=[Candida] subhashii TaxID=561895 RepID=A0A8J5QX19_9ASCO|nr:uncharacterized protein J8A68_002695 [[Candida] subhashii]KAG7663835.1 hypothetical protein J8A68_002695 [[Candida] subhashii]
MFRKKPPQLSLLEELQQTYTDCCNLTIKNLTLEEDGKLADALKGWKSLHTSLLYKLELFEKSSEKLSAESKTVLGELKAIRDQNVKHLIRVQLRMDEVNRKSKREGKVPPPPPPRHTKPKSTTSIPSFRVSSLTSGNNVPRPMMKSLRPHSNGGPASRHTSPPSTLRLQSAQQASKAAVVSWQKPVKDTSAKSQYKSSTTDDLFQDFDQGIEQPGSSRSSSGVSEPSEEDADLLDFGEDDMFRFNSLYPPGDYFPPEKTKVNAISKSMDDLAVKQTERTNRSQSVPKINVPKINVDAPKTQQQKKATPQPKSRSSPDIRSDVSNATPTKRVYVYNKPKPINVQKMMQTQSAKHQNATKPIVNSPPKAKSTSNIQYKYVKTQPKKKTTTQSKQKNSEQRKARPTSRKETADTSNPAMDDLLSLYDEEEEEVAPNNDPSNSIMTDKEQDELIASIRGIDPISAKQILNDIVVHGDEVYWDDIVGLESAKNSLKEAVVYPFLRPDLFRGLREPTRGMLLFGPPGTGKTMLARAVATESHSTFFSISSSSLTSKYLGESEKLVKSLFLLAKKLAPSIVFMDEIDSLLCTRSEGELESMRRIKNEFLVQWSELSSAAAGRESESDDVSRVLILGATNMPWSIDEAARRRFVRRQYIPLPEGETRKAQLKKLLEYQKNTLSEADYESLVDLTEGFSGSDITALAKDAAMGPLRALGEKLLSTPTEQIRPIQLCDFIHSLDYIRPSVSKEGLAKHEEWARKFGSSGV